MSVFTSAYLATKTGAKGALTALGVGDAVLDPYRRARRVRAARAFLEAGYLFPENRDAVIHDFSEICLNTQLSIAGVCNLEFVARLGLKGAFVECGTWRGGALGYWARSSSRNGIAPAESSIWGFDSFEGMPQMTESDGEFTARWLYNRPLSEVPPDLLRGALAATNMNVAREEDVWQMLGTSPFPRKRIHVVKGWFQDSLAEHAPKIGPIAVLRLDGDFYESTRTCLAALYDRVIPGGVVIIDDYGVFPGCRRAVDEFFHERGISSPLIYVDVAVRFFFKP